MCYEKLLGILEGFYLLGYITYLEYVGLVDNLTELYIGNS